MIESLTLPVTVQIPKHPQIQLYLKIWSCFCVWGERTAFLLAVFKMRSNRTHCSSAIVLSALHSKNINLNIGTVQSVTANFKTRDTTSYCLGARRGG